MLCDDGSTDNTYEVARQNQETHPNIKLIRNSENCGLNITLNNCLRLTEGEYVARMDGDDVSLPMRFEKEVQFLDEHPEFAFVSCPIIFFDENGEFGRGKAIPIPQIRDFEKKSPFCHPSCMVRKSVYLEVGGYTESKWLIRNEDYNLWAKIYAKGYKGYNLPEYLYALRDDLNSARRRTFRGRINGVYSRWLAYRTLRFSFWGLCKYTVLSLVKGMLPIAYISPSIDGR